MISIDSDEAEIPITRKPIHTESVKL